MATDALESMDLQLTVGNNLSLMIEAESKDKVAGSSSNFPGPACRCLLRCLLGTYYVMLTDKFE
jgi:hypothetical protein